MLKMNDCICLCKHPHCAYSTACLIDDMGDQAILLTSAKILDGEA